MHVIVVDNLSKVFGSVQALENLSFQVCCGEIFGLLGPNGAGKTTALHVLMGLTTPSGGTVRLFGKDPFGESKAILPRINFSASYATLPTNLTALEALWIYGRLYGVMDLRTKIKTLIDLLEIPGNGRRVVARLSSGEQTRLNLAKSLLNDPELLLLDEPTANLDPNIAEKVRSIVRQIQQERKLTILYTSHNMREVESLCQRVLFIHHGRAVLQGSPSEIMGHFGHSNLEDVFIDIARNRGVMNQGESS